MHTLESAAAPLEGGERHHAPIVRRSFRPVLTIRGFVIALFCTYLLAGPASYEDDIVATVVALSLLTVLALLVGLTVYGGVTQRRRLALFIHGPDQEAGLPLVSGREIPILIRLPPFSIPPLFLLELEIEFEHQGAGMFLHLVRGKSAEDFRLIYPVRFPHRGIWKIRSARAKLGDQFGLSRFAWDGLPISGSMQFEIVPLTPEESSIPLLSSAQRAGDEVATALDRSGDPYDLKPYHPSDGLRKVVWKIFARSGALISRHPEASMTPEGRTFLFIAAGRLDDDVAGSARAYARYLERQDLEVYAAAEGMGELPIARGAEAITTLLGESVWNTAPDGSAPTLLHDWNHAVEQAQLLFKNGLWDRVVILVSAERLHRSEYRDAILALAQDASRQNVRPTIVVIQSRPAPSVSALAAPSTWKQLAQSWLTNMPVPAAAPVQNVLPLFLSLCASEGWEVLSEELPYQGYHA